MDEFNEAIDRVIAGPERKSRVISPKEKEIIAYHEAGHALVAHLLPNADRVYKITIVSRGMAGGFTRFLPEEDRHLGTRSQFQDMLGATLAGHVAEELVLGEMTTGPQNDIEQATKIARQMVTQWGMSERLGPRTFGRKEELVFLGREISEQRNSGSSGEIDEEVRVIDRAYHLAKKILTENRASTRSPKLIDGDHRGRRLTTLQRSRRCRRANRRAVSWTLPRWDDGGGALARGLRTLGRRPGHLHGARRRPDSRKANDRRPARKRRPFAASR
jgi:hypothetical protein